MAKLAIISSYNEACGNASYTHVLKNAFARHVEVEVIALDLFLLTKTGPLFVKRGDDYIRGIAQYIKTFDYVNIQFEAGLYGAKIPEVYRRIKWLIDAAPNLILTMHRVDPLNYGVHTIIDSMFLELYHPVRTINRMFQEHRQYSYAKMYYDIIRYCDGKIKNKQENVWICVHTKRDRRLVKDVYKFDNCFDYPIAFLTFREREEALAKVDRTRLISICGLPAGAKIVGVFGFITAYKGIETAIQAIARMPKEYYLCFFGSQHPQSIREHVDIDPYLRKILDFVKTASDDLLEYRLERLKLAREADPQMKIALPSTFGDAPEDDQAIKTMLDDELSERVQFVGNLPDAEFIEALRLCDAVVLPYLEVGQSMSAVVALATEAGARMYCSNNLSFNEVKKYYGDVFHTFDIGNYLELSQKILSGGDDFLLQRTKVFEKYNIEENIRLHLSKFGHSFLEVRPGRLEDAPSQRAEDAHGRVDRRDEAEAAPVRAAAVPGQ